MSDPTRTHGPFSEPVNEHAETRGAPPHPESGTQTAGALTHGCEPPTATSPGADGICEPVIAPPGFEIIREIGSGGMGVVYEARQSRLNRSVALKVLRYRRGEAKDTLRFLTEAEAVAAVRHPHVVQVYDFGQNDGRPFMVLELLAEGTLSDRLKDGKRLEWRDAAELVAKLAGAVQAMHDLGIVHRDLKPSNVMFSDSLPKITDFGLAKRAGGADLTRTQAVMGTPAYMAPEQAKGDAKFVGPAADVWALGAILYECLTGRRPFDAEETFAILRKVIDESPPRPRDHVPGLPRDLELIALKCLEKNPADRYPSAAALAEDLQRFLDGKPVSVRPAGPTERFVKWVKRNPVVAGFSTALAVVGLVGIVLTTLATLDARDRAHDLARSNTNLNGALADLTQARDGLSVALRETKLAREESETRGYLSELALAHQLWKANDLAGMWAALDRCPQARRKWEWHYLNGLSRPERAVYEADSLPVALAYSPDGKHLAYVTVNDTLYLHNLATGMVRSWPQTELSLGRLGSIAFHPSGGELAYASSKRVRVLDLKTGQLSELFAPEEPSGTGLRAPVIAAGYTSEGRLLAASRSQGEKARTWQFVIRDAKTGKLISTIHGYEEPESISVDLAFAAFSPDATRFAASVIDSGIRVQKKGQVPKYEPFHPILMVWDASSGKPIWKGEGGSARLGAASFAPDGKSLGFGRGRAVVTTLGESAHLAMNPGHAGNVFAVAFGTGGLLWSAGEDRLIRGHYHSLPPRDEQFVLRGCSKGVVRLAVSPDGKELAAALGDELGSRGAIYRFDIAALNTDSWRSTTGRHQASFLIGLSSDGALFAGCDFATDNEGPDTGRVVIRATADGKERELKSGGIHFRSAFRPDGSLLMVDRDHLVHLIGPDGKQSSEFKMSKDHSSFVPPLIACTPDGRTAAVVIVAGREESRPSKRALTARLFTRDLETNRDGMSAEVDLSKEFPPEVLAMLLPSGIKIDRSGTRMATTFLVGWQVGQKAEFAFRGVLVVWDPKNRERAIPKDYPPSVVCCRLRSDWKCHRWRR